MRLSLPNPANSVFGLAALRYASAVNRRSGGELKIDVYPNSQLASQQETVELLRTGVLDLAIQSSAVLAPLFPRTQVFDMPFLYKDLVAGYRVLDGSVGEEFSQEMETKGLVCLAWGTGGFKELETTTRAVVVPEDMKGLRIRIQSSALYAATYEALGAIPVTIDSSETLLALTQHTVDAIDVSLDFVTTAKYYTAVKHVAMLNHIFSVIPLMGSKRAIDALPTPLQKILREEGRAVVPYWRSLISRLTDTDIQFLKQNGLSFTEVKYPAFRRAMDPVYAMFQPRLGGNLLDRVSRIANSTAR